MQHFFVGLAGLSFSNSLLSFYLTDPKPTSNVVNFGATLKNDGLESIAFSFSSFNLAC
jgi:hypothetical protein